MGLCSWLRFQGYRQLFKINIKIQLFTCKFLNLDNATKIQNLFVSIKVEFETFNILRLSSDHSPRQLIRSVTVAFFIPNASSSWILCPHKVFNPFIDNLDASYEIISWIGNNLDEMIKNRALVIKGYQTIFSKNFNIFLESEITCLLFLGIFISSGTEKVFL